MFILIISPEYVFPRILSVPLRPVRLAPTDSAVSLGTTERLTPVSMMATFLAHPLSPHRMACFLSRYMAMPPRTIEA